MVTKLKIEASNTTSQGMAIPECMLTEDVKDTKAYRDCLTERTGIDVHMVQPQPSGPTPGTHREDTSDPRSKRVKHSAIRKVGDSREEEDNAKDCY